MRYGWRLCLRIDRSKPLAQQQARVDELRHAGAMKGIPRQQPGHHRAGMGAFQTTRASCRPFKTMAASVVAFAFAPVASSSGRCRIPGLEESLPSISTEASASDTAFPSARRDVFRLVWR